MFSITENNYYQEQTVSSMHRAYVRHQGESAGKRERKQERRREDTVKNPRSFQPRFLFFMCKNKQFSKYSSVKRKKLWRPGTHPHFLEVLQPWGLRGQLLPGALPGHTRCSFQDKLAGQGLSPSLLFNHLISTVPRLPNSRN